MEQHSTELDIPPIYGKNTLHGILTRLRNVIFPYLLSFVYRFREMKPRVYDVKVTATGMLLKMKLHITGICDFPIVDTMLLRRLGRYEPETSVILRNFLKEGDTVLELGAAEGYFSVQMSRYVGEEGKVYSFEPNPEFYKDCLCNLELNGCQNVVVKNEGLGGEVLELIDGYGASFRTESLKGFLSELDRSLDFVFIDVDARTTDDSEARQETELIEIISEYVREKRSKPIFFLEYILNDDSFKAIHDKLVLGAGYSMFTVTKRHFLFIGN